MSGTARRIRARPQDTVLLPAGFRFLLPADADASFATGDERMDDWTLAEYDAAQRSPGAMVIAKLVDERVAGVALVLIRRTHLFIERLARDASSPRGTGAALMSVIEDHVAPRLGRKEVRLEALGDSLRRYYRALGYVASGPGEEDAYWGWLIPMRKPLAWPTVALRFGTGSPLASRDPPRTR